MSTTHPGNVKVHELSICQAMLAQVEELAAQRGAQAVDRITIEVGPLAGVDPMLLSSAYEIVRAGTCAAHAVLCIEPIAVIVRCDLCGASSPASANRLVCAECGTYRTRLVSGDELRLRQVELRIPAAEPLVSHLTAA